MKFERAILILGGGLNDDGFLTDWSKARVQKGFEISTNKDIFIVLSRGTTHKPPKLDENGFPIDESVVMANRLINFGVEKSRIFIERTSFDTIGNIYFSKFSILDLINVKTLVFVTSSFHMPRTKAIVDWIFSLGKNNYEIEFVESENNMPDDIIESRVDKEQEGVKNILKLRDKIKDEVELVNWIFTEHKAYAAGMDAYEDTIKLKNAGKIVKGY